MDRNRIGEGQGGEKVREAGQIRAGSNWRGGKAGAGQDRARYLGERDPHCRPSGAETEPTSVGPLTNEVQ